MAVDELQTQFAPQITEPTTEDNLVVPSADYYTPTVAENKDAIAVA